MCRVDTLENTAQYHTVDPATQADICSTLANSLHIHSLQRMWVCYNCLRPSRSDICTIQVQCKNLHLSIVVGKLVYDKSRRRLEYSKFAAFGNTLHSKKAALCRHKIRETAKIQLGKSVSLVDYHNTH